MKGVVLLLVILFPFCLFGQTSSATIIDKILIHGLKKTKESFVQRFIESQQGEIADSAQIAEDCRLLRNLPSIANVWPNISTWEDSTTLNYSCEEISTLFPIVNFGLVSGNSWFQLGVTDVNFAGKGITATAYYLYNSRHSFLINSRLPFFLGKKWGMNIGVRKWSSEEPLYFSEGTTNYNYDNYSFELGVIHRLNFKHSFELNSSVFREDYAKSENQVLENPPGPQELRENKLLIKARHEYSNRDYFYFYNSGWSNSTEAQFVATEGSDEIFLLLINDLKYYKRLKNKVNLAARFRAGLSTNKNTPFAPFVLDSHVNIRGSGNRIDRGTGMIVLNLELRKTLIEEEKKWAIQGIVFADIGSWRQPGGTLGDFGKQSNQQQFIGSGIRFIHQQFYDAILRIDYGVDITNIERRGLVIGLGQYF